MAGGQAAGVASGVGVITVTGTHRNRYHSDEPSVSGRLGSAGRERPLLLLGGCHAAEVLTYASVSRRGSTGSLPTGSSAAGTGSCSEW